MQEKHKFILLLIIIICLGLVTGFIFGYITGLATSALGIVKFENKN